MRVRRTSVRIPDTLPAATALRAAPARTSPRAESRRPFSASRAAARCSRASASAAVGGFFRGTTAVPLSPPCCSPKTCDQMRHYDLFDRIHDVTAKGLSIPERSGHSWAEYLDRWLGRQALVASRRFVLLKIEHCCQDADDLENSATPF